VGVRWPRLTVVKHPHRVVERLPGQALFGVRIHLADDSVVRGELDVLDSDGLGLVQVGFPLEQHARVDGDGGPAVTGDVVVGKRHGAV
jgi:hypothetical protein